MAGLVASAIQLPAVASAAAMRGIILRPIADAPDATVRMLPWSRRTQASLVRDCTWRTLLVVDGNSEALGAGIDAGADDAVAHDASPAEIVARLAALLRIARGRYLTMGDLAIDRQTRSVMRGGRAVPMLPREYALLLYLAERQGSVVTRSALLAALWNLDFDPGTNVVAVQVSRLRARLESAGPRILHTGRHGYRLGPPGAAR